MKTAAWMDRRTPRDLYDFATLAAQDAVGVNAAELLRAVTAWRVTPRVFAVVPSFDWVGQLAHQTRILPSARECLTSVRTAYGRALGW
jgi:hypothetical protein